MTDAPPLLPPADWYQDPNNAWQQRWWNGAAWSEDIRPIPTQPTTPATAPAPASSGWHPVNSGQSSQPQVNFSDPYEPPPRPSRRGFLDSPFERAGTPRNLPGTLSLTFALLCFILIGVFRIIGIFIAFPLSIAAIVLAIVGIVHASHNGGRRGTAIAGLVVGIIFLMGTTIPFILGISAAMGRAPAIQSDTRIPGATAAAPTRIPITTSKTLEERVAVSIEKETGWSAAVKCPEQISTDRGSEVSCTGIYSDGTTFDLEIIFLHDNGPYSWNLTPTG